MPKKSVFAGGWSETKAEQIEKIEVPPKIRCSVCKKIKGADTYSKKQRLDLKHFIALGHDIKHSSIRCRKCTGTQTHEMTCAICGETKGLDGFSKAQRRTPDSARCYECVNEHLALRPGYKDVWDVSSDDDDEISDYDSDELTNNYESATHDQTDDDIDAATASMQRLTAQNLENHGGSEVPKASASEPDTEQLSIVGKEKGPARASENNPYVNRWNYAKANSKRPTEFTAYDSTGTAHQRVRAPSTAASDEWGSVRTPRSSNFAKVKSSDAGPRFPKLPRNPTPPPFPVQTRNIVGRQVQYSDSESDDEWGTV